MTDDTKHKSLTDAWAAFPHPDEPGARDIVKARAASAVSIDCQNADELKAKLQRQNQAGHWSDADLSKIAADAWAAEADKRNEEDADEHARISGIRKRRDDSIEHAAIVKKIMETLFVGQRQGYYIADEGTTDRAQWIAMDSTISPRLHAKDARPKTRGSTWNTDPSKTL